MATAGGGIVESSDQFTHRGQEERLVNTGYDVIVIGAGPAGENAADLAARAGLSVAIVESELVGGECSYWGCMPSKALLRPGEVLEAVRRTPGAASAVTGEIDVEEVLARRDAFTSNWDDAGQVKWLTEHRVDLVRGRGRLAGTRRVEVESQDRGVLAYEAAKAVVVATGTTPALPPVAGLDEIRLWDNREVTSVKEIPGRLLVIGGGVIGVEMAQAMIWLGAEQVTIVELFPTIISREEPFAGIELRAGLERAGIVVHTEATVEAIRRPAGDAPVSATVKLGSGERVEIVADEVLVATGRRAATADLGLETVGLTPGRYLAVDDHMRVKDVEGGWLYAVGDVNGRALLTHIGKYQGRIAGAHIAGLDTSTRSDQRAVPRVVFTEPQVAAVGLTLAQARDQGFNPVEVKWDLGKVAGTSLLGRGYRGTAQLVIDPMRQVIVGATFVGPHAGEIVHAATIAIVAEVPLATLWHAVPSFPTVSEVWLRLLEAYRDQTGVVFR